MSEVLSAPYVLEYTYKRSTGPVIGRFFAALAERELLGVKTADGRILCPPQEYDESGQATTGEFVALAPSGTLRSWSRVPEPRGAHPLKSAFSWGLIQIDGADNAMLHAIDVGEDVELKSGSRVRIRWAPEPTGSILDIACFEPLDGGATPEAETSSTSAPEDMIIDGPVHLEYSVRPGLHYSAYLKGLQEGKFIGGRCPQSGKVYVPPRGASPTSGLPTSEYVEVADCGVLTTFTVVRIPFPGQILKPPYCFGAIVLDGSDLPIYHLISGVPYEEIRMGMRVRAKWKPRDEWGPSLENVVYFEPTGEADAPFESYQEHL